MPFDPFKFVRGFEGKKPELSRRLAIGFLGLMSPFNSRLKTRLIEWTDNKAVIVLKRSRGVRNHVGSIHAGAQFTLGETCAGLVIIRNFPFGGFRPLMSNVSAVYSKQARSDVTGECILAQSEIDRAKESMAAGEVPTLEMTTRIYGDVNGERTIVSIITTMWQVKPWGQVKSGRNPA